MSDATIHGLTLEDCAAIQSRSTALEAEHGQDAARPLFDRWLQERGVTRSDWTEAWNGWWSRMEADPSGQLQAEFARHQRKHHLAAHHADVPDASADMKEGVSLAQFAQVMARLAGGEEASVILAELGIEDDRWQRAQAAWNTAMAADVDHHLTTQYGLLYAKFSPGFEERMQAQTAAMLSASRGTSDDDGPDEDYTLVHALEEMASPDARTRWTAAHHAATEWDCGERGDPELDAAARQVVTLARACLKAFDQDTVSEAEALADDLQTFASEGFFDADALEAIGSELQLALERARAQLAEHEAALEPVRNSAVPERVRLQSAVQDFTSLVEELESIVEDWSDHEPPSDDDGTDETDAPMHAESTGTHAPVSTPAAADVPVKVAVDDSPLAMLKALPVIGDLLRMLGL